MPRQYHYSTHGVEGDIEAEGLSQLPEKGMLAGEDVLFGADFDGRDTLWCWKQGLWRVDDA